jgi:hypothetical protein
MIFQVFPYLNVLILDEDLLFARSDMTRDRPRSGTSLRGTASPRATMIFQRFLSRSAAATRRKRGLYPNTGVHQGNEER